MNTLSKLVTVALVPFGLAGPGCDEGDAVPDRGSEAPLSDAPAIQEAALSLPVLVANTSAQPVPVQVLDGVVAARQLGTWNVNVANNVGVTGKVQAEQAGAWNVALTNPLVQVAGQIEARQLGPWSVDVANLPEVVLAAGNSVAINNVPTVEISAESEVAVRSLPPVQLAAGTTVAVTSLPAVTLAGAPSVDVSGTVTVDNDDQNPVPVRMVGAAATSQPWQVQKIVALAQGEGAKSVVAFDVPSGKRLVIEYVDAFLFAPTGQRGLATVTTQGGGSGVEFIVPLSSVVEYGGMDQVSGAQTAKFYADGGTSVSVGVQRNAWLGTTAQGRVTLSGYLVDAP